MVRLVLSLLCLALGCGDAGSAPPNPSVEGESRASLKKDEELRASREPTSPAAGLPHCGDPEACYRKALDEMRAGRKARATQLFQRGCEEDRHALSCNRFALALRDGIGIEADESRARRVFEQGCALGSKLACDNMGH